MIVVGNHDSETERIASSAALGPGRAKVLQIMTKLAQRAKALHILLNLIRGNEIIVDSTWNG